MHKFLISALLLAFLTNCNVGETPSKNSPSMTHTVGVAAPKSNGEAFGSNGTYAEIPLTYSSGTRYSEKNGWGFCLNEGGTCLAWTTAVAHNNGQDTMIAFSGIQAGEKYLKGQPLGESSVSFDATFDYGFVLQKNQSSAADQSKYESGERYGAFVAVYDPATSQIRQTNRDSDFHNFELDIDGRSISGTVDTPFVNDVKFSGNAVESGFSGSFSGESANAVVAGVVYAVRK